MDETVDKNRSRDPARKWLYVSFFGIFLCVLSLGMHVFGQGGGKVLPLPDKVMRQVFGFTPYYFEKMPVKLELNQSSAKFLGNALSYELESSKKEKVIVSEKVLPDGFTGDEKQGDMSIDTSQGRAVIGGVENGRRTGSLITKDKTLINLDAPASVSSDTIEALLRNFIPITPL